MTVLGNNDCDTKSAFFQAERGRKAGVDIIKPQLANRLHLNVCVSERMGEG